MDNTNNVNITESFRNLRYYLNIFIDEFNQYLQTNEIQGYIPIQEIAAITATIGTLYVESQVGGDGADDTNELHEINAEDIEGPVVSRPIVIPSLPPSHRPISRIFRPFIGRIRRSIARLVFRPFRGLIRQLHTSMMASIRSITPTETLSSPSMANYTENVSAIAGPSHTSGQIGDNSTSERKRLCNQEWSIYDCIKNIIKLSSDLLTIDNNPPIILQELRPQLETLRHCLFCILLNDHLLTNVFKWLDRPIQELLALYPPEDEELMANNVPNVDIEDDNRDSGRSSADS